MIPLLIILAIVVPVFGIGLWAALRHQRKFNEQQQRERAARPAPPDPDRVLVADARRAAEAFVFDPALVEDATEQQLVANPAAFHMKTIRVTATWGHQFESSTLAGAWVRLVTDNNVPYGQHRVQAQGLWVYPRPAGDTKKMPGFGHLGLSWGEFRVVDMQLLGS